MKHLAVIALSLILANQASSQDFEFTGNDLEEFCGDDFVTSQLHCVYFVLGLVSGQLTQAAVTDSKLLYCIPPGVSLGQVVEVIQKSLKVYPEDRHKDASALVTVAIMQAFPCE